MHWADFLHVYQPPGNIVATARRWQESGQTRHLRGYAQLNPKQLTFSS